MERDPMEMALSTDTVMDSILSRLKAQDLLNCRKVSKFWNRAASSVFRKRSTMIQNIYEEDQLMELQECIEQSSDFPFAGLAFSEPWKFSSASTMDFFENYGARFTRLRLDTSWTISLQELAPFINHLPRLSILEEGWSLPSLEILDPAAAAAQEDGKVLKLSSVRTIRLTSGYDKVNEDVLREVFTAASPSLRIECLYTTYGILKALSSAGKLQAVSIMNECRSGKHALAVAKLLSTKPPTLTKLDCSAGSCISGEGLMKLLISSQYTLKELRLSGIYPSEFSSDCPVLVKLTSLSLRIVNQHYVHVFQGRQGHKFPNLKELKLDVSWFELQDWTPTLSDGLFIVPSLTTIDFGEDNFDNHGMEGLAQSFPNVTEIRLSLIMDDTDFYWPRDPSDIWSVGAFKFLEKLRIQWPSKNFENSNNNIYVKHFQIMNMDSFLTGLPIGICENLRKNNQQNVADSTFNEILQDRPSILQLINLKELTVCVKLEDRLERLPKEPPFISMVSVWHALQMIANLQTKFVYDCQSPVWRYRQEDRDKAVTTLKAAFKHVQPYIKLEPFFY